MLYIVRPPTEGASVLGLSRLREWRRKKQAEKIIMEIIGMPDDAWICVTVETDANANEITDAVADFINSIRKREHKAPSYAVPHLQALNTLMKTAQNAHEILLVHFASARAIKRAHGKGLIHFVPSSGPDDHNSRAYLVVRTLQ